jgi:hypothetical protein
MRKEFIVMIASILAIGAIIIMIRYESTLAGFIAYTLTYVAIHNALK